MEGKIEEFFKVAVEKLRRIGVKIKDKKDLARVMMNALCAAKYPSRNNEDLRFSYDALMAAIMNVFQDPRPYLTQEDAKDIELLEGKHLGKMIYEYTLRCKICNMKVVSTARADDLLGANAPALYHLIYHRLMEHLMAIR